MTAGIEPRHPSPWTTAAERRPGSAAPAQRQIRCRALAAWLLSLAMLAPALANGAGERVDVTIRDYRFEPVDITITRGTTVRWTNHEKRTSHSILFIDATIGESERLFPDEQWEWTFDTPGVYPYRCGPHEEMHGSVTVTD